MEETMDMKTKRFPNFREDEKQYLIQLVQIYPEINLKGYDSGCLEKKAKSWNKIFQLYSSHFPTRTKRDLKQIQGCWKRLKDKSKRSLTDESQAQNTNPNPVPKEWSELTTAQVTVARSRSQSPITLAVADLLKGTMAPMNSTENASNPFDDGAMPRDDAATGSMSEPSQEPHVEQPGLAEVQYQENRGRKKRGLMSKDQAAYLTMAKKEHALRMKIHQLQEWKLRHECLEKGYGLPQGFSPPH